MDMNQSTPKVSKRLLAKAKTRQEVLVAATKLFAMMGFDKATVRDIAREAGLSTGAVFANFKDKLDLFEAVACEQHKELLARFEKHFSEEDKPNLNRIVRAFREEISEMREPGLRLMQTYVGLTYMGERPLKNVEAVISRIQAVLAREIETGTGTSGLRSEILARDAWDKFTQKFTIVSIRKGDIAWRLEWEVKNRVNDCLARPDVHEL